MELEAIVWKESDLVLRDGTVVDVVNWNLHN